jgi:hypothetical protein
MGLLYRAALRTTRMQSVADDIDSGSGAGYLEICTASYASVLATITLSDPCGSVSGDVLTLTTPHSDTSADNTGDAAIARIKNSSNTTIVDELTVGKTGDTAHIILAQATVGIVAGQTVALTSATITHNTGS